MSAIDDDDEIQECGYVYDHEVETTFEDDKTWQGVCARCGAELWEDRT